MTREHESVQLRWREKALERYIDKLQKTPIVKKKKKKKNWYQYHKMQKADEHNKIKAMKIKSKQSKKIHHIFIDSKH